MKQQFSTFYFPKKTELDFATLRNITTDANTIKFEYTQPRQCYASFQIECIGGGGYSYAQLSSADANGNGHGYCANLKSNHEYSVRTITLSRETSSEWQLPISLYISELR